MAEVIQLLNTRVEMQQTLGSAKTITAISNASEVSITATHDFDVGDIVVIDEVVGMVEINRRVGRVKTVSTTVSFVLELLDSTNWGAYVSGGTARQVTAFVSFETLTNFDFPEPQPNPQSITTIHDTEEREVFGLDSAPTITMNTHAQPSNAAIKEVRESSIAKDDRAMRVTFQDGTIMLMNVKMAGGRGISGEAGGVASGTISLKLRSTEQYFDPA